jgi:hypothetical protein
MASSSHRRSRIRISDDVGSMFWFSVTNSLDWVTIKNWVGEESFLNSLYTIHGDFNLIFHDLLTIMRSSSSSKKGQLLIALVVTLRVISQERQSLRCWYSCLHGKLAPRPFQFPHDGGENEVMHPWCRPKQSACLRWRHPLSLLPSAIEKRRN